MENYGRKHIFDRKRMFKRYRISLYCSDVENIIFRNKLNEHICYKTFYGITYYGFSFRKLKINKNILVLAIYGKENCFRIVLEYAIIISKNHFSNFQLFSNLF